MLMVCSYSNSLDLFGGLRICTGDNLPGNAVGTGSGNIHHEPLTYRVREMTQLLFHPTRVWFPGPTLCPTNSCNSNSRGSNTLSYVLWGHHTRIWYTDMHGGNIPIHKTIQRNYCLIIQDCVPIRQIWHANNNIEHIRNKLYLPEYMISLCFFSRFHLHVQ